MHYLCRLRYFFLGIYFGLVLLVLINFRHTLHGVQRIRSFPGKRLVEKNQRQHNSNVSIASAVNSYSHSNASANFTSNSSVHFTTTTIKLTSTTAQPEIKSSVVTKKIQKKVDLKVAGNQNENENDISSGNGNTNEKLHVDTPGCTIPVTKILPAFYEKLYFYPNSTKAGRMRRRLFIPDCRAEMKFATLVDKNTVMKFDSRFKGMNCTLSEIKRMEREDNNFTKTVHKIDETSMEIDVSKMELLLSQCGEHLFNFDARILIKPEVKKKIEFWEEREKSENKEKKEKKKTHKKDSTPIPNPNPIAINVLILGFDSISRSHFYRSMPKSARALQLLDFIDFRGFHSLGPSTLPNLERMVYNLDANKDCYHDSAYDDCPMIWKEYSALNYLTMYNEDGSQTFNWGGQDGFRIKKPTDFYLHPLFMAHKFYRPEADFDENKDCVSSETVPQFLLRYINEFLDNFSKIPFYAFTYFNCPWHDDAEALSDFDLDLATFLSTRMTPEFLEKTFVIIFGDHGERYGLFNTYSMEGYLERSLPALFIRPPDLLLKKYPSLPLLENLKLNSRRLISARDVYQTVVHTLLLSEIHKSVPLSLEPELNLDGDKNVTYKSLLDNFHPVENPGRSSLFLPIPINRTCTTLEIELSGNCICNSATIEDAQDMEGNFTNPFLTQQLIIFAVDELNRLITESKWKDKCVEWDFGSLPHISTQYLRKEENFQDVFLKFIADADREDKDGGDIEAQFQVQIRIHKKIPHPNSNGTEQTENGNGGKTETGISPSKQMEIIGTFNRIDRYGEQSWCIYPMSSQADKAFKETCVCTHDKDMGKEEENEKVTEKEKESEKVTEKLDEKEKESEKENSKTNDKENEDPEKNEEKENEKDTEN